MPRRSAVGRSILGGRDRGRVARQSWRAARRPGRVVTGRPSPRQDALVELVRHRPGVRLPVAARMVGPSHAAGRRTIERAVAAGRVVKRRHPIRGDWWCLWPVAGDDAS